MYVLACVPDDAVIKVKLFTFVSVILWSCLLLLLNCCLDFGSIGCPSVRRSVYSFIRKEIKPMTTTCQIVKFALNDFMAYLIAGRKEIVVYMCVGVFV